MKRNTLIWRLATVYGGLRDNNVHKEMTIDICTYVRYVLSGVWHVFLILIFAFVLSLIFGDFAAWAAASVTTGTFVTPSPIAVLGISSVMLAVLFFSIYLGEKLSEKIKDKLGKQTCDDGDAEPSLISTYIQSIKDKTCYTLHIEPLENKK